MSATYRRGSRDTHEVLIDEWAEARFESLGRHDMAAEKMLRIDQQVHVAVNGRRPVEFHEEIDVARRDRSFWKTTYVSPCGSGARGPRWMIIRTIRTMTSRPTTPFRDPSWIERFEAFAGIHSQKLEARHRRIPDGTSSWWE
jgi:hypothetical protein